MMLYITSNGRWIESSDNISGDTAIRVMKEDVAGKLEVEEEKLTLFAKNQQLEDGRTLRSYGIESNEKIKVLISKTLRYDSQVGCMWSYREQLYEIGMHKELGNNIYMDRNGIVSIICSRDDERIVDNGHTIALTSDNEFTKGSPFQVIRKLPLSEKNPYRLSHAYRYDGIYEVEQCYKKLSENGRETWCHVLRQVVNLPDAIPTMVDTIDLPDAIPTMVDTIGPISGIEVGYMWTYRDQAKEAGVHKEHIKGICTIKLENKSQLASSIVVSGEYTSNVDQLEFIIYTGSNNSECLSKENKCLANNCSETVDNNGSINKKWRESTNGVRVLRKLELADGKPYSRVHCYRYDGIYKVVGYWIEHLIEKKKKKKDEKIPLWRFLLARHDSSPLIYKENIILSKVNKPMVVTKDIEKCLASIEVGTTWITKEQMSDAKVHTNLESNISVNEQGYAISLLLSTKNTMNVIDKNQFIVYTVSDGNELENALARNCYCEFDQQLRQNGHVSEDCEKGIPVRVVRYLWKSVHYRSDKFKIAKELFRYDGLYYVVAYWPETSQDKSKVWRYILAKKENPEAAAAVKTTKDKDENKKVETFVNPLTEDVRTYILDLSLNKSSTS